MQALRWPDRRFAAIGDLVLSVYADPAPGGGRGALGFLSPGLSIVTFAVLVSESDGRPMNPSKLSDYAGVPRPTLYRKLDILRAAKVLAPGDIEIRADPSFLSSDLLRQALLAIGCAVVRCAASLDPRSANSWCDICLSLAGNPARLPACSGVLASLALDLARLSFRGDGPWFAAESRSWLVRWSIARAAAEARPVSVTSISAETGVSRAAVYRQLVGAGLHGEDAFVGWVDGTRVTCGLHTAAEPLAARVLKAFHRLSEMDGDPSGA